MKSKTCKYCQAVIQFDEGAWLDATKGEGCTDDHGNEQVHAPQAAKRKTRIATRKTRKTARNVTREDCIAILGKPQDGAYFSLYERRKVAEALNKRDI